MASVLRKVVLIAGTRGGGALASILVTFLVSRRLATEDAASFFIFMTIYTVVSINIRWGGDEAIIKAVASSGKSELGVVRATTDYFAKVRMRKALAYSLPLAGILYFFNSYYKWVGISAAETGLALLAAVFSARSAFQARYLHGAGDSVLALIFLNIITPYIFLAFFLLPNAARDSEAACLLYAAAAGISLVVTTLVINKKYPSSAVISTEKLNDLLASSGLIAFVVISQQIFNWGMQVIAPVVLAAGEYKYFTVSYKTSAAIGLLMLSINFALSPLYARLYHQGRHEELRRIINLSLGAIVVFSTSAMIVFEIFAEKILRLGKVEFNDGGSLFLAIMLVQVVSSLAAFFTVILSMAGQERFLMRLQVAFSLIGLVAFGVLANLGGILAALMSVALTYVILSGLLVRKTWHLIYVGEANV